MLGPSILDSPMLDPPSRLNLQESTRLERML
jgi:hypothetical protein